MAPMTPESLQALDLTLSLSVEEQERWQIPDF